MTISGKWHGCHFKKPRNQLQFENEKQDQIAKEQKTVCQKVRRAEEKQDVFAEEIKNFYAMVARVGVINNDVEKSQTETRH